MGRGMYKVNPFNPMLSEHLDLFTMCASETAEAQGIDIDTIIHEAGAAQFEFNFEHGDPLLLADQVFVFKRAIREAAQRNGVYATFMSKPMEDQPGSAMHIHQSVVEAESGANIFSDAEGEPTDAFFGFVGGQQRYLGEAACLLAPYVNSYRRFARGTAAPTNLDWAYDNRKVGLRVPLSDAESRRVENRVPSSDANPYLAMAASLACGYLGLQKRTGPRPPIEVVEKDPAHTLPRSILDAVRLLEQTPEMAEIFGEKFIQIYRGIKESEFETFMNVISPWEREFLLLNV